MSEVPKRNAVVIAGNNTLENRSVTKRMNPAREITRMVDSASGWFTARNRSAPTTLAMETSVPQRDLVPLDGNAVSNAAVNGARYPK